MVYLEQLLTIWKARKGELWAAGLFTAYALILSGHRSPASLTDFSDWTYEGVLLRDRLLGLPDPAHILKHYPVPNSLTSIGIALFALASPWNVAAKLWLAVLLLLSFVAAKHLLRSCGNNASLWLIAPAAIFLNVNLWYGFVNFQIGVSLAVLFTSLLLRGEARGWLIGLLLTLIFFAHMIPFAFASLLLVLYSWQNRRPRLIWLLLPGALLSFWYVIGRFTIAHNADGDAGMVATVSTYSWAFWAYKANSYLKSLGFINPGTALGSVSVEMFGPVLYILFFTLNAFLCGAVAWCLWNAAVFAYRNHKRERFVWTAALFFLPLYFLAPATALGISDPGSRLLQTTLGITIFLSTVEGRVGRKVMRCGAACAMTLQLAALYLFIKIPFSPQHQAEEARYIPHAIIVFAHVPNHAEDVYYRALQRSQMDLRIFPTGMFSNTSKATDPSKELE